LTRPPLRVLHLRDSPWIDGPGRTILETALHIDRARVDYHVGVLLPDASRSHPLLDALRRRGLPAHEIADDGRSVRSIASQVTAIADELDIQVLHTSELRSNLAGLLCRPKRPVRLICTAHGWIANDLRGSIKVLLDRVLKRRFDHVILVSGSMRSRLPRWWLPDERVSILRNALVRTRFESPADFARRRRPPGSGEIRLLNVGRLSPEKGQILLLRALARLSPNHPGLTLTLAGIGPSAERLAREARDLGLSDRVRFVGYVEDMSEVYAEADVVVQSSTTEGLPNVILEASYLRLPIVATDAGGTREVIEHGVTGWLVRPGSVQALAEGISCYLLDPSRFHVMAAAAARRVGREFTFEARTAALEHIYEKLCGRWS
jgi:glycosyltransferase involved in cell wall biosynthesis